MDKRFLVSSLALVVALAFAPETFAAKTEQPAPTKKTHAKGAAEPAKKAGKAAPPPKKGDPVLEKVDALQGDVNSLRQTVDEMQKKIDDLNKRVDEMKKPVSQAQLEEELFNSIPSVTPEYVHLITSSMATTNAGNPIWSPVPNELAYEQSTEKTREIVIAKSTGEVIRTVGYKQNEEDAALDDLLSGTTERVSYNTGLTWNPSGEQFIYMGNGGEGNYDLYMGAMFSDDIARLTEEAEKDGHAHWSPTGDAVIFVSGREGTAQLYFMDTHTRKIHALTKLPKSFFYPMWSPDGRDVLVTYGDNDNHDILLLKNVIGGKPELVSITNWEFDDLRPKWSPDGKKIAFYTNYSPNENDDKAWSLVVVDVTSPKLIGKSTLVDNIVATNVVPQIETGPAWMPDSTNIVFVKKDERIYNPLFVVNTETKASHLIRTKTKINNDVACGADGLIAFRAQDNQWDRIFVTKLPTVIQ